MVTVLPGGQDKTLWSLLDSLALFPITGKHHSPPIAPKKEPPNSLQFIVYALESIGIGLHLVVIPTNLHVPDSFHRLS